LLNIDADMVAAIQSDMGVTALYMGSQQHLSLWIP